MMLSGTIASAGIGIGKAIVLPCRFQAVSRQRGAGTRRELRRFQQAVELFTENILAACSVVRSTAGPAESAILEAQLAVISDPELNGGLMEYLDREQVNVEYAFRHVCRGFIRLLLSLEDPLFRARADDVRDVMNHVLAILAGVDRPDLGNIPQGSIIVCDELFPSAAATMDPSRVAGIVAQKGAAVSHVAILSRAMGLPALVKVDGLLEAVRDGDTLILDGEGGTVYHNPTPCLVKLFQNRREMCTA